jgi:hypothetical protein
MVKNLWQNLWQMGAYWMKEEVLQPFFAGNLFETY